VPLLGWLGAVLHAAQIVRPRPRRPRFPDTGDEARRRWSSWSSTGQRVNPKAVWETFNKPPGSVCGMGDWPRAQPAWTSCIPCKTARRESPDGHRSRILCTACPKRPLVRVEFFLGADPSVGLAGAVSPSPRRATREKGAHNQEGRVRWPCSPWPSRACHSRIAHQRLRNRSGRRAIVR
jgi:hypothetical protein